MGKMNEFGKMYGRKTIGSRCGMHSTASSYKLWFPLILLMINVIFISLLIEELVDATSPNYGGFGLLTPFIALISFFFIRKRVEHRNSPLMKILQIINGLFVIFPIGVFVMFILIMI